MDQEFDLRSYVMVLARHWRLIVAAMLIAALIGGIVTSLRPPLYRATVRLAIARGQFFWQFTPAVRSVLDPKADLRRGLADLIRTEELAAMVIERTGDQLRPEQRKPKVLARQASGKLLATSQYAYELYIEDRDPQIAALLANTWADVLAEYMENQYGLGELTKALERALAEQEAIDQQLLEFNARTGIRLAMGGDIATFGEGGVVTGLPSQKLQLVLKGATLADHKETLDALNVVLTQAQNALGAELGIRAVPLELLNTKTLADRGITPQALQTEYADNLSGLVAFLRNEQQVLTAVTQQLDREVYALQRQLAEDELTLANLERDQQLARETVINLSRQVEEIRSQRLVEGPLVSVMVSAEVPERPSGLPFWGVALVAALIGALAGTLAALTWEAMNVRVAVRQPATG